VSGFYVTLTEIGAAHLIIYFVRKGENGKRVMENVLASFSGPKRTKLGKVNKRRLEQEIHGIHRCGHHA
jgi:hypothetical protein